LDKEVAETESGLLADGDPKQVADQLLTSIDRIAGTSSGGDDDQTSELEESA
jgi:hypothetical protein